MGKEINGAKPEIPLLPSNFQLRISSPYSVSPTLTSKTAVKGPFQFIVPLGLGVTTDRKVGIISVPLDDIGVSLGALPNQANLEVLVTAGVGSGVDVGSAVGSGVDVGSAVGSGVDVGSAVGSGVDVGSTVGSGVDVGSTVGFAVGVGSTVGFGVDVGFGVADGSAVGEGEGVGLW